VKPADLAKEIAFPLTDVTVLMAIIVFGSLLWISAAAGLLGLWLLFIVVPAIFRYSIYLLEARAHGKKTLVVGIEAFNIADNIWGIFPLLLLLGFAWLEWQVLQTMGSGPARVLLFAFFIVFPACMAVVGITRSPVASVNPVALWRLVRRCGISYVYVPAVLTTVALLIIALRPMLPAFAIYYLSLYVFFLLFTLTGAVVYASNVPADVGIEAPLVKTADDEASDRRAERRNVLGHAYGFISRGNREGGFRHLREHIASEPDADDAAAWFFNEMMRWERRDAALFFGQECFAHFLHHDKDAMALKIASRCLHEDPRWRPRAADRQHAIELAEKYGREDLLPALRS
jgi:hypothetical protein